MDETLEPKVQDNTDRNGLFGERDTASVLGTDANERHHSEDADQTVPVVPLAVSGIAPGVGPASTGMVGGGPGGLPSLGGGALFGFAAASMGSGDTDVNTQHIAQAVENALMEDGRLPLDVAAHIGIEVTANGIAVLTGHAPTSGERDLAARIVAHVGGVRGVDNRVTVA